MKGGKKSALEIISSQTNEEAKKDAKPEMKSEKSISRDVHEKYGVKHVQQRTCISNSATSQDMKEEIMK